MGKHFLIVVDMQNDFVSGSLGTAEAQAIVPAVVEKVKNFDGTVIFTRDTHHADYLSTQEGKFLPVEHCMKDTEGWQIVNQLDSLRQQLGCKTYDKETFGSTALATDMLAMCKENKVESITLVGLCTDICVVSNALLLKAFMPETPMHVVASCCAGVTPAKHEAALETMRSSQIIVD